MKGRTWQVSIEVRVGRQVRSEVVAALEAKGGPAGIAIAMDRDGRGLELELTVPAPTSVDASRQALALIEVAGLTCERVALRAVATSRDPPGPRGSHPAEG